MRRLIVVAACSAILTLAIAPSTRALETGRTQRTQTKDYVTPYPIIVPPFFEAGYGGVTFLPKAGERYIEVAIEDSSGQVPYVYVNQDPDGDGTSNTGAEGVVCGGKSERIQIEPKVTVTVIVQLSPVYTFVPPTSCPDGGPATTGTVTATFTKAPKPGF